MIAKAKVNTIGLHKANAGCFSVAGYGGRLGYHPAHRKRLYKTYNQALRYSIELRDYYQVPVQEY